MSDLYDLIKSATSDLQDWINDNPGDDDPHDTIHEIADSSVPVYNSDLLDLARENLDLALNEPEIGPAFDGSPTPINIIAANVYEYITSELWDYFNEHKDDYLDEDNDYLDEADES